MDELEVNPSAEAIEARRQSRLDSAREFAGESNVETQETLRAQEAARQERTQDQTLGSQLVSSAQTGIEDTAAFKIGEAVGLHATGEFYGDEDWNPKTNDEQFNEVSGIVEELGLDFESSEAKALATADSRNELYLRKEQILESREKMQAVADGGLPSMAAYMAANIVDVDSLIPVYGIAKKIRKAKQAEELSKLSKTGNIIDGAKLGLTSGLVVEGTRAALDPTADAQDAVGAAVLSAGLGGLIGAASKVDKPIKEVAETQARNRIISQLRKAPEVIKESTYKKASRFTLDAEGGIANVAGDRGGATAFGISSKFFPKQHAEITKVFKEKGERAAKRYANSFYKKEFYDKVVTNEMTPAQAQVVFDTAVHSGIGKAKELFKKAGGNVNRMLDAREEFFKDIVRKDPTQEKFLRGWLNRVNNLRQDVATNGDSTREVLYGRREFDPDKSVGAATIGEQAEVFQADSVRRKQDELNDYWDEHRDLMEFDQTKDDFVDTDAPAHVQMIQKTGEMLHKGINKTFLASDFERFYNSAGPSMKSLVHQSLVDPLGRVVNNRNMNDVAEHLNRVHASEYAPNYAVRYSEWAKDKGISKTSKKYYWDGETEFNKEVMRYREYLQAGKEPDWKVHQSVIDASDDLDRAMKSSLDAMKRLGVEGAEDLEFKAGHNPRKWRGDKFASVENLPGVGSLKVIQSIKEAILRKNPELDENQAFIWANAIRRSAKTKSLNPANELSTTNNEIQILLEDLVNETGVAANIGKPVDEFVADMLYKNSERGLDKSVRSRIDLDMTTPIEGTDKTLLDLVDEDTFGLADQLIRNQSNLAAKAQYGWHERDIPIMRRAVVEEAMELGKDGDAAAKAFDDLVSYFGSGAFAGGQGPVSGRLNKLARLSFLPQLGITQVSEAGVALGVVGAKSYLKYAKKSIAELRNKDKGLMSAMYGSNKYVGDHRLFVRTDHLDDVNLDDASAYMRSVDLAMDKGMRAMGHISGFYKVNEFLQIQTSNVMNNYVVQAIRDGKHSRRLDGLGVDAEYRSIIKSKIDDGTIEFDAEGDLINLNVEAWEAPELELQQIVTRRYLDNMVQRGQRGEQMNWQYGQLGSLFSNLKTFTFTAMHKQLIRNMRNADPEAFGQMMATTATAALAVSMKAAVNGDLDKLSVDELAERTLKWSPMLSPGMMALDPLAYTLGMDDNWRYQHGGMLSAPGLSAANQLLNLPRAAIDVLDGDIDNASEAAFKALPIVGRSYPVSFIEGLIED